MALPKLVGSVQSLAMTVEVDLKKFLIIEVKPVNDLQMVVWVSIWVLHVDIYRGTKTSPRSLLHLV